MVAIIHGAAMAQDTLSVHAAKLMLRLNGVVAGQICGDAHSADRGAAWCPGCGLYHTRAAEALFPLAWEYKLTGRKERLDQAIGLGEWLIAQQKEGGEWVETPETWTGTTTDQLLMMALAWPILKPHMTGAQEKRWLLSMERAGDYLARIMDNAFASINYCATTTATLSELDRIIPKKIYRDKARELARMIVAKMNPEYFIDGEGSREGRYKYGVDIGYNMEMSLWGLARYADLAGDAAVREAVVRSLESHLWFIYPDGTLDASAGIRSNKWTVYGSGTSDGCHPLMALLSDRNPAYVTAAVRNIGAVERSLARSGLLGTGPHYDLVRDAPPCIYPTFTKAKSMAMAMAWVKRDVADDGTLLPVDTTGYRCFPTLGIAVVRSGAFCGTVTAYNYKAREGARSKYMHRPAGGALSALWVEGFGLLQASSQTEYHRWEPMSFPELPADVKPLTPRIEVLTPEAGLYTNLYDFDATHEVQCDGTTVVFTAYGQLKNRGQSPCGIGYTLRHCFETGRLVKEFVIARQTLDQGVRLIEPLIAHPGVEITQSGPRTINIAYPGNSITLALEGNNATMRIDRNAGGYDCSVYPALRAVPVVIDVAAGGAYNRSAIKLTYTLNQPKQR